MKFLGFLLIILGSALLIMQKWFAGNPVLTWMKQYVAETNNMTIGISVDGAGVLLLLIGFLTGGRRDEI